MHHLTLLILIGGLARNLRLAYDIITKLLQTILDAEVRYLLRDTNIANTLQGITTFLELACYMLIVDYLPPLACSTTVLKRLIALVYLFLG